MTNTKISNRTRYGTHDVCVKLDCTEPAWIDTTRGTPIRMNTPYCERHCSEFNDAKWKDAEFLMGH